MRKTRRGFRWAALAAVWACAVAGSAWAAKSWTLLDIGTLGGASSYGTSVSNSGLVAGCSEVAGGGAVHAFLYRDGQLEDLGTGTATGDGNSCGLAVASDGTVAGRSATGDLVVWKGGAVTNLGVQGEVGGMNEAGVVVGRYVDGTRSGAFLYRDGTIMDLGTLGDPADPHGYSAASAVNMRQEVVGTSNGRAFLYADGAMRDLGTLGGGHASANGINDRGQVVGMASDAQGRPTAFLYDGTLQALPGYTYAGAVDINNRAQVVASGEGVYGYLVVDGSATRLDKLPGVAGTGWHHLEPKGINDRGWIVGTAFNPDGQPHAFLLMPK